MTFWWPSWIRAATSDRVVMEAFHYRCHPLALRVEEIVAWGELGKLQHVETAMCFPLPKFSAIRYSYALAGGATMDGGCPGAAPVVPPAHGPLRERQTGGTVSAARVVQLSTGRIRRCGVCVVNPSRPRRRTRSRT